MKQTSSPFTSCDSFSYSKLFPKDSESASEELLGVSFNVYCDEDLYQAIEELADTSACIETTGNYRRIISDSLSASLIDASRISLRIL